MLEKCKSISIITVVHHTLHVQMYIYSDVCGCVKILIVLLYYIHVLVRRKSFRYIFHYSKVKSYFIAIFQGTHLNEVFKTIQGVYSLKIALVQNLGMYQTRQIMSPLK